MMGYIYLAVALAWAALMLYLGWRAGDSVMRSYGDARKVKQKRFKCGLLKRLGLRRPDANVYTRHPLEGHVPVCDELTPEQIDNIIDRACGPPHEVQEAEEEERQRALFERAWRGE